MFRIDRGDISMAFRRGGPERDISAGSRLPRVGAASSSVLPWVWLRSCSKVLPNPHACGHWRFLFCRHRGHVARHQACRSGPPALSAGPQVAALVPGLVCAWPDRPDLCPLPARLLNLQAGTDAAGILLPRDEPVLLGVVGPASISLTALPPVRAIPATGPIFVAAVRLLPRPAQSLIRRPRCSSVRNPSLDQLMGSLLVVVPHCHSGDLAD